ncbi:MAG: DUF6701 domain-containing protein [Gammaproteobacteria bacterium]|nr:DUF6701 domain-containing protein [Gammaproteobacteria bacterium]
MKFSYQQLALLAMLALGGLAAPGNALGGPEPKVHATSTTVSCTPDPAALDTSTTCTATVTDLGGQGPLTPPSGTVSFTSSGTGSFSAGSCVLTTTSATSSSCSVTYTPTVFGSGTHTITASYGGGTDPKPSTGIVFTSSSGNYALTLAYPAPVLTSITPSSGLRGDVTSVTVSGSGFVSGGTSLDFGANITQSNFTVVSSTQITVDLAIDLAASTGARDVTVSNPTPGGGSDTLVGGFTVLNPLPQLASLSPASVESGSGAVSVTINGNGFLPESIAYFAGSTRSTTFINSSQLIMDLSAADTATVGNYSVTVVNPGPGGGTSNALVFSVVVSGGSFDAVHPGEAIGGPLHMRLAGVGFDVDLLATDVSRSSIDTSFTGTVKVELLNAADDSATVDANGCRSSWTTVATLPDATFTAGDNGRITVSLSYASALRVGRIRMTYPASGTPERQGCSSDAFSIRPTGLVLASSLNNGSPSGSPVARAGDTFSMTATAVSGYDGTPQLDAGLIEAHAGAIAAGTLSGSFGAADPSSGSASGSFTYDEVGAFRYQQQGLFDSSFTAVDQPDGCTSGFSNTLVGGLYGCSVGNASLTQWVGRFRPHHFDVSVIDACSDAGGFSYSGQPFDTLTITARNASGGTTQNYDYKSGDLVDDNNYSNDVTLSFNGSSSEFSPSAVSFMDFSQGVFAGTNAISYRFADPETAYTLVAPRATDPDGTSSSGHLEESTEVRSGRLAVSGGTAITTNDAQVPVLVQTWQDDGSGIFAWLTHDDDTSCTSLAGSDLSLENFTGDLASGETSITNFTFTAPSGSATLAAPGSGNAGSVDLRYDLSARTWLRFDADSDGTLDDATGTVRFFEIFATEDGFIYRREVID